MFLEIIIPICIGLSIRFLFTLNGIKSEILDFLRDRVNHFVFYFIIPLICFKTTYSMPLKTEHLKISLIANLTILSSLMLSWLIYRFISKRVPIKAEVIGSLIMCASFGNVLYIGLPILTKLYGQEGTVYAFTYDFLASTPLTWTVAVAVCMKYGKARGLKIKDSILTLIKISPIWGLIFGFIVRESGFEISTNLLTQIDYISHCVTVFMLMIVGFSVRVVNPKKLKLTLPAILIKVLISPLFALAYGILFGLSGIPLKVCIIDAAMPSMLLSMIFASTFGVDMRTAVEMIFLTTVLSLIMINTAILVL